jgi:hypothetical protein
VGVRAKSERPLPNNFCVNPRAQRYPEELPHPFVVGDTIAREAAYNALAPPPFLVGANTLHAPSLSHPPNEKGPEGPRQGSLKEP